MVFETLVFGWFFPAKEQRKDSKTFGDGDTNASLETKE
jgi:hypothetical protein